MSNLIVSPVSAFADNYIWVMHSHNASSAIVVDPGEYQGVVNYLQENSLQLLAILLTHHHADHIGGVQELLRCYPGVDVYGPQQEAISVVSHALDGGDLVRFNDLACEFQVMDVPGHTSGHIAYYLNSSDTDILFCGDTLFAAGCGRLFEGTAQQLYASLQSIAELPSDTKVYCAHEYTLNNIKFALTVDPTNAALQERQLKVRQLREQDIPSIPSTLAEELATNPFLRTSESTIKHSVASYCKRPLNDEVQVFAELRKWKDRF